MTEKSVMAKLLTTPWVSSFVGRARKGDLHDVDQERRAAAWSHWAIDNLAEFKGLGSREYIGVILPGAFHDPRGNGPQITPHIEVPGKLLSKRDAQLPDRLAQAGNGLLFPWWVFSEVTAIKRALFGGNAGDVSSACALLGASRTGLEAALIQLNTAAQGGWSTIEAALLADAETMAPLVTGDFTTAQISEFFPSAAPLELTLTFDEKLRETQGLWASRRVGVWTMNGTSKGQSFSIPVITPRLTANSLFSDPLFAPTRESAAALLVRALILRRIVTVLGLPGVPGVVSLSSPAAPRYLRAVVARPGAKLPQASVRAAVHFLQTHQEPTAGWAALQAWAGDTYLLTVAEEAFTAAHTRAMLAIRRTEDPGREDIDTILPICWDDRSRVVRVTFSLPEEDEQTTEPMGSRTSGATGTVKPRGTGE